ncbi:polysaccharide biosynthesis C-terminal domain-containing protein [Haliangium ochraceum]|uniref:Polysaccharide biosynthesis protein n=1 Tax=Haliangium ochraceum (strain DSM 14365 / JCM 11303 / SMP-2) TaxID=502025 RepID=D0LSD6_HALO1|nr:polysaccharide biosynthesis C-terminal domain-containing protein [Haliangium ochraceum]ACY15635.1 polysaccharide biosynthesis protein [Haliangium ochraceum DSM 14365]
MDRPAADADETRLSDKAVVVVFSRVLSTLVELATIIMLVRLLSKETMAIIGFLLLVYQTTRYFATFGFPESVFYFFEKLGPPYQRAFALRTFFILGAMGAFAAALMLALAALAPQVLRSWEPGPLATLRQLLPWLALVAVLEIPTWPMNNVLLALDRQKAASWYQMLTSAGSFVALVVPVLLGAEISVAIYGLVIFAVARFAVTVVWFQLVLPGPSAPLAPGTLREQVRFAVPLGLNALSSRVNKYLDKFVVSVMLPVAAFAEYQVGGQELPLITAIPYGVGSVFISRFVALHLAGDREGLLALWYRGIEGVSLVVVPVAMLFVVVAHDFITLVFGAEYAPAVLPFQIYTLILLHRVTQYSAILQAHADTASILRFTMISLLSNLVLSVPLTWLLGLSGPALATLLSALVTWYVYLKRIGVHLGVGLGAVFPWAYYGKVVGVAAVAGAVCWGLRYLVLDELPQMLALSIATAAFLLVYAALGALARVIDRSHWRILGGWVRLRFLWR